MMTRFVSSVVSPVRTPRRALAVVAFVVALSVVTAPTSAQYGYVDREVFRARLALQRTNYLLDDSEFAARSARVDYDSADHRAADLSADMDRKQQEVDDLARRFDDDEREAHFLREEVDRQLERLDARPRDLDAARQPPA